MSDSMTGSSPRRPSRSRRLLAVAAATALAGATLTPLMMAPANAAVPVGAGVPAAYTFGPAASATTLKLCTAGNPLCIATSPSEEFWFSARAKSGLLKDYRAELERALDPAGKPIGFARLRFKINGLRAGVTYQVDHPYGSVKLKTNKSDPNHPKDPAWGSINVTTDAGICTPTATAACDWTAVGKAFIGNNPGTAGILRSVNPTPGALGNIVTAGPVTGAPSGNNLVQVTAVGGAVVVPPVRDFTVQAVA
jgi:hypothetical protein